MNEELRRSEFPARFQAGLYLSNTSKESILFTGIINEAYSWYTENGFDLIADTISAKAQLDLVV